MVTAQTVMVIVAQAVTVMRWLGIVQAVTVLRLILYKVHIIFWEEQRSRQPMVNEPLLPEQHEKIHSNEFLKKLLSGL
jgi:hypothetical protein